MDLVELLRSVFVAEGGAEVGVDGEGQTTTADATAAGDPGKMERLMRVFELQYIMFLHDTETTLVLVNLQMQSVCFFHH